MVRVSIDVDGAAAGRSRLSVRAESIQSAVGIAAERNPGCSLRIVFPLDPETFFVGETAPDVGSDVAERVEIAA